MMRVLIRRIEKTEERVCPKPDDGLFTLEEPCRTIWRQDEKAYRKMETLEYFSLRYFIPQFEREGQGG